MPSSNQLSKQKQVADLKTILASTQTAIVAHYQGISVAKITKLRSDLRKSNVKLQVIKNTLVSRAVTGNENLDALKDSFQGPTALAYTSGDPVGLAKVLTEFAKKEEKFKIRAGALGGKLLAPKEIEALAKLPSKEVLLSRLVGALQSPYAGLVYTLSGVLRKFVYALDAVRRKKEEQGGQS